MGSCVATPAARSPRRVSSGLQGKGDRDSRGARVSDRVSDPDLTACLQDESPRSPPSAEEELDAVEEAGPEPSHEVLRQMRVRLQQRRHELTSRLEQVTQALKMRVPALRPGRPGPLPSNHPARLHCRHERASNRLIFWTTVTLVTGNLLWSFIRSIMVHLVGDADCQMVSSFTHLDPRLSRSARRMGFPDTLRRGFHNFIRSPAAGLHRLRSFAACTSRRFEKQRFLRHPYGVGLRERHRG